MSYPTNLIGAFEAAARDIVNNPDLRALAFAVVNSRVEAERMLSEALAKLQQGK